MQIGKLRHRIVIQSAQQATAADGGVTRTWQNVATVWGSVEPGSGREFLEAQRLDADLTHEVHIRHDSNVTVKHRLYHDSRGLEIVSIRNIDDRDIEQVIMCKEDK